MFSEISSFLLRAVNELLAFFYALPVIGGSYGVAIIMLTVTVMIALMPLTLKATKSTIKMTMLQPQLRALQKEYKDDKTTLNQEMMALYQREGINPVGGCLPMVAQAPVFIVLFNVLRGLVRREWERPYFALATHGQELAGFKPTVGNTFDPANLDHGTRLYQDLSRDTSLDFLGGIIDLGRSTSDVVSESPIKAIPYLLMIAFVVATSFYQQRQIQARRTDDQQMTPQQKTQQQMLKILPLLSGFWSFAFPAGLVLYWCTSNTFRIGQQAYITRSLYQGDGEGAKALQAQVDAAAQIDVDKTGTSSSDKASSPKKKKAVETTAKKKSQASGSSNRSNNGSASRNGSSEKATSRSEEWERMRKQRAKTATRAKSGGGGSSRTTPKGTKPQSKNTKKKR